MSPMKVWIAELIKINGTLKLFWVEAFVELNFLCPLKIEFSIRCACKQVPVGISKEILGSDIPLNANSSEASFS